MVLIGGTQSPPLALLLLLFLPKTTLGGLRFDFLLSSHFFLFRTLFFSVTYKLLFNNSTLVHCDTFECKQNSNFTLVRRVKRDNRKYSKFSNNKKTNIGGQLIKKNGQCVFTNHCRPPLLADRYASRIPVSLLSKFNKCVIKCSKLTA